MKSALQTFLAFVAILSIIYLLSEPVELNLTWFCGEIVTATILVLSAKGIDYLNKHNN